MDKEKKDQTNESIKNNETHSLLMKEKKVSILQTLTNMYETHKGFSKGGNDTVIVNKLEQKIINLLDNF